MIAHKLPFFFLKYSEFINLTVLYLVCLYKSDCLILVYDALGRVKSQISGGMSKNYVYDSGSYRKGRLYYVNDSSGQTLFTYDKVGNITQKRSKIDSKYYYTYHRYNNMNQLTQTTYPSGHKVNYSYDSLGNVSSVTYQNGTTIQTVANHFKYLPFGPLKSMSFGNGAVRTISHDLDYRPTKIYTSGIQNLNYLFDTKNNIRKMTNSQVSNLTQTFTYDNESRLNSVVSNSGNHTYGYDKVGNRKNHTASGLTESLTYSTANNQLTKVTSNGSQNVVSYNGNGQIISKGGATFYYNSENRLSSHVKSSVTTSFVYNALGQRVRKSGANGTTHYLYNEQGQLIAEHNSSGTVQKEYIYLHGQVVAMIKSNTRYYVHNDHMGRAERITNQSKGTVWRANNYAFDRSVATNSIGDYNLGFPGQYYDKEMGTYYNYFRDYDPSIGRYIQSDPIGLAGGINTYGYVGGNPLTGIDFFGLDTLIIFGQGYSGNPLGHSALAFSGRGVYSYGTRHNFGSAVTGYLAEQGSYRGQIVITLKTTSEQEARMIAAMNGVTGSKYDLTSNNCATTNVNALAKAGIGFSRASSSVLPLSLRDIGWAQPGMQSTYIPQGGSIPSSFSQFNPNPFY